MFKNIAVAVDGSPCAEHAYELALRLASHEGATLGVCSVADPSPLYGTLEPPAIVEAALAQIHEQAQRCVDEALAKAKAAGVVAQGNVLEGEPVYEIVRFAGRRKADAIVIGTHGRSGLRRLFMGSVAEGVLRTASMPVITVREHAYVEPEGEPQDERQTEAAS